MKFNAVLTKEQAKEMFAYLEDIFTEVTVPEKKTGIR